MGTDYSNDYGPDFTALGISGTVMDYPPALESYLFLTSLIEIERIWSTIAVELRVDDATSFTPDGSLLSAADMINDCIMMASDMVYTYLDKWYSVDNYLQANQMVRRFATYIACHLLSLRRGNLGQYTGMYNEALDFLQKVYDGKMQIPRLATRFDMTPAMDNYRVDDRFFINKIRVQQSISRGGTYSTQDLDPTLPYQWY